VFKPQQTRALGLDEKQQYHSVTHPTVTVVGMGLLFSFFVNCHLWFGQRGRRELCSGRVEDAIVFDGRRDVYFSRHE
jgi:hypothetical protein